MDQNQIEVGDSVKHKTLLSLNGGLMMSVVDTNDDRAKVAYFDGPDMTHNESWFNKNELEIIKKQKGGFTD